VTVQGAAPWPTFSDATRLARVTTDDAVELAIAETGDPRDPGLLLVPGFGGAKEDFADHVDALAAAGHHVVTFDHRGHGASDQPDDPASYSLDRLAADVRLVAAATDLHDVRLLGHSMGGMVVRRVAIQEPRFARALVFMDTSPGAPPDISPELALFGAEIALTEGMAALKEAADQLDVLGSEAYQRVVAERPGFLAYAQSKFACLSAVMWATLAVEITTQPLQLDALEVIDVATLVVVGEQDLAFLAPSRAIAAAVPDAQLVVIPDAGHSPQFENPTAWRAAIAGFLATI
jgi:pimeloyl-ACP methyl ester carboxylesterase